MSYERESITVTKFEDLRQIALNEAQELADRYPDGEMPQEIWEAIQRDEQVARDLARER